MLEGRVAHSLSRIYLIGSVLLAIVIPLLELPIYPSHTVWYEFPVISSAEYDVSDAAVGGVVYSHLHWSVILKGVLWVTYGLIVAVQIVGMLRQLWLIIQLRRRSELTFYEVYTLAVNERVRAPFSFWRTIFMNHQYTGREREQVIIHEKSHVQHHHSAEKLLMELVCSVMWFNPFVWLIGSALAEVHEWEADSDVLKEGYDVYEYRQIIFRQLFGYNPDITCGLFSQTSKKRFLMMTKFKKGKLSFMRFGAAIPLVAIMVMAFGAVSAEPKGAMHVGDGAYKSVNVQSDDVPFTDYEELHRWMLTRLRYPADALKEGMAGVVNVTLVVEPDGHYFCKALDGVKPFTKEVNRLLDVLPDFAAVGGTKTREVSFSVGFIIEGKKIDSKVIDAIKNTNNTIWLVGYPKK